MWTWVLVISLTVVLGGLQATLFAVALATAPESLRTTVFDDATPIWVLGVGDCIAGDPVDDSVDGTVTSANVVPCDQPHEFEVFAADAIEHDPDFDEPDIAAAANEFCLSQFSGYVGTGYQSSALELLTLYPDGVAWSEGDADVTCILESPESVTASLRGSEGTSA